MLFIFHSLILLSAFLSALNKITLEYSLYNLIPFIPLSFPTNPDPIYFPINTNLEYTWLNNNSLTNYKYCEINQGPKKIKLKDDEYQVFPCQTEVEYDHKTILPNYNFFMLKNIVYLIEKREYGCGLSFKFQDEKFSLVHQLFNSKLIDRKSFAFEPVTGQKRGYIHFGGTPYEHRTDRFNYQGSCHVTGNSSWGCALKSILIGNKTYSFNINTVFQSSLENMIESIKFFEIMTEDVFKKEIERHVCEIVVNYEEKRYLECSPDAFDGKMNVTFEFNDLKISFPILQLFFFADVKYHSRFSYDYNDPNMFDFGFAFFNRFNLSIFDYDEQSIKFYSENILITQNSNDSYFKFLLCIVFTLCLISILIFLYLFANIKSLLKGVKKQYKAYSASDEELII